MNRRGFLGFLIGAAATPAAAEVTREVIVGLDFGCEPACSVTELINNYMPEKPGYVIRIIDRSGSPYARLAEVFTEIDFESDG